MKKYFSGNQEKQELKYDVEKIARIIIEFLKQSDREKRKNFAKIIQNSNTVDKFMELNSYADYNMHAASDIINRKMELAKSKEKWLSAKPEEKIITMKTAGDLDGTGKIFIDFLSKSGKLERARFASIIKEDIVYDRFLELNKYIKFSG